MTDPTTDTDDAVERRSFWTACLAPHTSKHDLRNSRRLIVLMLAWGLSRMLPSLLQVPDDGPTTLAVVLGLLSSALFLGVVGAMVRFVRETDELNRLILLRSFAVGFAVGVVVAVGADMLLGMGAIAVVDIDLVALTMIVAAGLTQMVWTASYR